jgi:hypothetical protein
MKIRITLITLALLTFPFFNLITNAQNVDTALLRIPIIDSVITYQKVISSSPNNKEKIFNSVISWISVRYNNSNDVIKLSDKVHGEIVGTASTRLTTSGLFGVTYDVRYTIKVNIKDDKYRLQITNFIRHFVGSGIASEINYVPVEKDFFKLITPKKHKEYNDKNETKFFILLGKNTDELLSSLESSINKSLKDEF